MENVVELRTARIHDQSKYGKSRGAIRYDLRNGVDFNTLIQVQLSGVGRNSLLS
jgi:hypothetical protein